MGQYVKRSLTTAEHVLAIGITMGEQKRYGLTFHRHEHAVSRGPCDGVLLYREPAHRDTGGGTIIRRGIQCGSPLIPPREHPACDKPFTDSIEWRMGRTGRPAVGYRAPPLMVISGSPKTIIPDMPFAPPNAS